jgi:hypothetical protein
MLGDGRESRQKRISSYALFIFHQINNGDNTMLTFLKIGQTKIIQPKRQVKAEVQYMDPLTFKSLKVDDRVTVTSPKGITVDFKIISIDSEDTLVLGPLSNKTFKPVAYLKSFVMAHSFKDPKSNFQVQPKDIIILVDRHGKKTEMRVDMIIDKDFLVLDLPTNKKPMGFINKLKFIWNVGNK